MHVIISILVVGLNYISLNFKVHQYKILTHHISHFISFFLETRYFSLVMTIFHPDMLLMEKSFNALFLFD